ncbi:ATPase [Terrihabitans soli]|uniref:ATPase n=1 Tax=Terrihabitans soli TaxID=708113 RepID=A0A6S6QV82_9HYPH|nr:ATP12 family protein [Terrihabitans soli]BCJ91172.1 ATPase [Terrihabitans soli]
MSETEGPMQRAQRLMRPELPKRFYKSAEAAKQEGGYGVLLDGRSVRTPARNIVSVPGEKLALALAEEWNAQIDVIDPAKMPLTRLVNSAIDGVAREADAVRAEIVKYAASDLLCYRAEAPERLVENQRAKWDPVLDWAHETLGARFVLAEGIVFVEQPASSLEAISAVLERLDIFRLAAASVVTTLTGSALLTVALIEKRLTVDEAWAAAHVDEDWNAELWGEDDEAAERRAGRFAEMQAAARVIDLLRR